METIMFYDFVQWSTQELIDAYHSISNYFGKGVMLPEKHWSYEVLNPSPKVLINFNSYKPES